MFLRVKRRSKRRNARLWRFKQRFRHRNGSGFGVLDVYVWQVTMELFLRGQPLSVQRQKQSNLHALAPGTEKAREELKAA